MIRWIELTNGTIQTNSKVSKLNNTEKTIGNTGNSMNNIWFKF